MTDWQQFATTIVGSAAWPLVVLVLGIVFRKTLRDIIERVTGIEAWGAKLQFAAGIKKLDAKAERLDVPLVEAMPDGSIAESPTKDKPVREGSPAEVILGSWHRIENSLVSIWSAAKNLDLVPVGRRDPSRYEIPKLLRSSELLPRREYELIQDLRTTRNEVAHTDVFPSEAQATIYANAAHELGDALQELRRRLESQAVERAAKANGGARA